MKKALLALIIGVLAAGCSPAAENRVPLPSQSNQNALNQKVQAKQQSETSKAESIALIKGRWGTVTRVVDGDTLELEGREKVRLIGVNTPETVKPGVAPMPYGKEASNFTKKTLSGKRVFVETDVQPKDRYGRTLAYIYLQEPKSQADLEKIMVNAMLLEEGYAQLMTIQPNSKYADLFVKLQRQGREAKKGMWSLNIYKDSASNTNDVYLQGKAPKK